jgi:tetratricopeptide (TPR) repeat protein
MPEAVINKTRDFVETRFGTPRKKFLRDIGAVAVILAFPILNLGVETSDSKYTSKYQTIAHEIVDLEHDLGATDSDYKILDSIIYEATKRIEVKSSYTRSEAIKVLQTIHSILEERGFASKVYLLFNRSLKKKGFDCSAYSITLLAIGEVLGLPLHLVRVPGHIFVRWDPDGQHDPLSKDNPVNREDFNWETVVKWIRSDDYYVSRRKIPRKSIQDGVFLGNLSRKEVMAVAYSHRAKGYEERGDLDKAIASFEIATRLNPKYHEAFNNLGTVWRVKGDLDKAIENYEAAIRLSPKIPEAYNNLGAVFEAKGDLNRAIENYRVATILNPKLPGAYYNLGNAWSAKGDLDKAIVLLKFAVRLNPKYSKAHNNLGAAWGLKGELDKAVESFEAAIRSDPKYSEAYNNLGAVLETKGDLDRAIENYQAAIRLNPKFPEAYYNLGDAWKAKGDLDKAIENLESATRLNRDFSEAWDKAGIVYYTKGQFDKAIQYCSEAIRSNPQNASAFYNRSLAWKAKGKVDNANKDYEEAIRLNPELRRDRN